MACQFLDRRDSHSSGTEFASCLKQPTRMTDPETGWSLRSASSLFGFAPGGVYNAISVARNAVGSYPTLSPLPRQHSCPPNRSIGTMDRNAGGAVSFLWHFPWGHPRRTLSGTVLPWSPDFPLPCKQNSGHPAIWRVSRISQRQLAAVKHQRLLRLTGPPPSDPSSDN